MILESHPRRNDQILSQETSGSLVLFNLVDGQYFALNDVGARVWELCDGSRSVSEMVSIICQEFNAPSEIIEADVLEFLNDLAHEKMVAECGNAVAYSEKTA